MSTTASAERIVETESVMGTVASIDVRGDATSGTFTAIADAMGWFRQVDETFSTYRDDSAIRRIDRGELAVADASADVRWILSRCEELRRETAGYFDARAGGALDPSALVKGWSVERAARLLTLAGLEDFCITVGGDIVCRGGALPEPVWRIGIQHPLDRDAIAAVCPLSGLAVATSGAYERGDHVRDPHTGEAPSGTLSVTVVGADLATADAYSTAAFAMGAHGPKWLAGRMALGYESLIILGDHSMLRTPGFPLAEVAA